MFTLSVSEYDLLREFIEAHCGIAVGSDKQYLIETRLAKLVLESGCGSYLELYNKVKYAEDTQLKIKIIDAMTTNETLWFRDDSPYQILETSLLPEIAKRIQNNQQHELSIWSAACSSGQEPYSISMTIHEYCRKNPQHKFLLEKTRILATDISPSILMLARLARYDSIAMSRNMKSDYQERYFKQQGNAFVINPEITQMVKFQQFNLQNDMNLLGHFDVVFLRNVAIYFSVDFKKEVFHKIAMQMNRPGYLFLGASETINGYSQDFTAHQYERGYVYHLI